MDDKHILFLEGPINIAQMEWLPIGRHTIQFLQEKLEGRSPKRNFFVTSSIDRERNVTAIDVGKTEVMLKVEDYIPMEQIRFTAKVDIEATGSHVQEEFIGVEVEKDGRLTYGVTIQDRGPENPCSMDEISYIIADITEDSSRVMDTIFNSYQKRLLDIVFCEQSSQRDKFLLLFARRIIPDVEDPQELYTNIVYRSELRQILGEPQPQYYQKLENGTMIIVGDNGVLVISEDPAPYEDLLQTYGLMGCIVNFENNIFNRLSWSWDLLYEQKRLVQGESAERIMEVQNTLSNLSADQGMLLSVPAFIRAVTSTIEKEAPAGRLGSEWPFFKGMLEVFSLSSERIAEVDLALKTLGREIENIRLLASTLSEKQAFGINRAMNILTVVSVIILPLTLITGVYGMNFYRYQPEGSHISTWNMPELYWHYGYPITLCVMALIASSLLFLFWRQGLLLGVTAPKDRKKKKKKR